MSPFITLILCTYKIHQIFYSISYLTQSHHKQFCYPIISLHIRPPHHKSILLSSEVMPLHPAAFFLSLCTPNDPVANKLYRIYSPTTMNSVACIYLHVDYDGSTAVIVGVHTKGLGTSTCRGSVHMCLYFSNHHIFYHT